MGVLGHLDAALESLNALNPLHHDKSKQGRAPRRRSLTALSYTVGIRHAARERRADEGASSAFRAIRQPRVRPALCSAPVSWVMARRARAWASP